MARPVPLLLLVLTVLVASSACMAPPKDEYGNPLERAKPEPIPPSLEPIVLPNPGAPQAGRGDRVRDRAPVSEEDAGWADKLDLAAGYAAGGFDDEAMELIHAALAQDPPSPWKERFVNLRATLRVRRMENSLLRIDARGVRDYASFGSDVDWRIRIRNVSAKTLVFPAPGTGKDSLSPTAFSLTIVRRDLDIYGGELRRSWTQTVFLQRPGGQDITIAPGGAHETTARVPSEDVGTPISGMRILELAGTLRGVLREEGGEEQNAGLRIRPGRVVVLPDGYEPLAREPLTSLETAIEAVAPTHLLIAAEFVPRAHSDRAVEILARALAEGDRALRTAALGALGLLRERNVGRPLAAFVAPLIEALRVERERGEALMEGLTRLSGQTLAPDLRLWEDWWRRAAREGTTVSAPERGPGATATELR